MAFHPCSPSAIERGAKRPMEIAQRLGTAQTNLSRLLPQLLDASVLARDLPWGQIMRTTKKVLYRILDPTMRFWFRVYSPHRSLWRTYNRGNSRSVKEWPFSLRFPVHVLRFRRFLYT